MTATVTRPRATVTPPERPERRLCPTCDRDMTTVGGRLRPHLDGTGWMAVTCRGEDAA